MVKVIYKDLVWF